MKKKITIEDHEDKEYGAGKKYTRFNTSEGWIACFDKKTIKMLKRAEDDEEEILVKIETDDDDRAKVTKAFKQAEDDDDDDNVPVVKPGQPDRSNFQENTYNPNKYSNQAKPIVNGNKGTTMYTSYAKDIFVAIITGLRVGDLTDQRFTELMNNSIELVKQAQKAFE